MEQGKIFISYSRANSDFVLRLAKDLKAAGKNIWLDQLDIAPGARWDDELERALETCETFMVILTPASMTSQNVKDEIGYAIDTQKRIVPVLLENATLPLRLRRFQYVDFTSKSYADGVESAKRLLSNLGEESTNAGIQIPPAAQADRKATETHNPIAAQQARTEADRKDKELPGPGRSAAVKARTKSALTQKKPASRVFMISAFAAVVLVAGLGSSLLLRSRNGNPGTAGPVKLNSVSASEASQLFENTSNLEGLAIEIYGDQFDDLYKSGSAFQIENSALEPLVLSVGWCSQTQHILEENYANLDIILEFNGQEISDINIASIDYTASNGWACRTLFSVLDNWASGTYSASSTMRIVNAINDGLYDYEAGTSKTEFVVSIP